MELLVYSEIFMRLTLRTDLKNNFLHKFYVTLFLKHFDLSKILSIQSYYLRKKSLHDRTQIF